MSENTGLKEVGAARCFGGTQYRYAHTSEVLNCDMHFSVYLPTTADKTSVPVIYWLSGLTCTDENFVQKAGAQQYAEKHQVAVVAPDTSPRGEGVSDDPDGAWDFGLGAGFYLNATQGPWSRHYKMYDYIVSELPRVISGIKAIDITRAAISGHSMGGHGALTIALKNQGSYVSASAFAPISAPMQCPWGHKALSNYLGDDHADWEAHDAVALLEKGPANLPMLIDQGEADPFLEEQLKIDLLQEVCARRQVPATINLHAGYDHSYFFIASFIGSHIDFHARHLGAV